MKIIKQNEVMRKLLNREDEINKFSIKLDWKLFNTFVESSFFIYKNGVFLSFSTNSESIERSLYTQYQINELEEFENHFHPDEFLINDIPSEFEIAKVSYTVISMLEHKLKSCFPDRKFLISFSIDITPISPELISSRISFQQFREEFNIIDDFYFDTKDEGIALFLVE